MDHVPRRCLAFAGDTSNRHQSWDRRVSRYPIGIVLSDLPYLITNVTYS
jgi:hypothetical protein